MKFQGFEWDEGNWPKCSKHGLSKQDIEEVLSSSPVAPVVMPDPSPDEPRMRAIGQTAAGRYVFLVFMLRKHGESTLLRPISARYMHMKEIKHYENQA